MTCNVLFEFAFIPVRLCLYEVADCKVSLWAKGGEVRIQRGNFLCGGRSEIFCRSSAVKGPGKLASVEKKAKLTRCILKSTSGKGCDPSPARPVGLPRMRLVTRSENRTSTSRLGSPPGLLAGGVYLSPLIVACYRSSTSCLTTSLQTIIHSTPYTLMRVLR